MPRIKYVVELEYKPSFRSQKVAGMFDIPAVEKLRKEWDCDIPIDEKPWQIGLIVGTSGSGKTTIANQLFPNKTHSGFAWNKPCLLDDFPESASMKDITMVLSQVGFSSPPHWLLPYSVLSNGQKFRVELARCLFEYDDIFIFDEFTSVVDRQVAQVGAFAFQKAIRKSDKQFIAVTCHYDVEPWLQPDWVFDVSTNEFKWGSVRRPELELTIQRVHYKAWELFKEYHYLSTNINKSAICYIGFLDGRPVVFDAWLPFFGKLKYGKAMRGHRTVVIPDFQGLGLGDKIFITLTEMWSGLGYRVFSRTAHPAEINKRLGNSNWRLTTQGRMGKDSNRSGGHYKRAIDRLTCGFEWSGNKMGIVEATALYGKQI